MDHAVPGPGKLNRRGLHALGLAMLSDARAGLAEAAAFERDVVLVRTLSAATEAEARAVLARWMGATMEPNRIARLTILDAIRDGWDWRSDQSPWAFLQEVQFSRLLAGR